MPATFTSMKSADKAPKLKRLTSLGKMGDLIEEKFGVALCDDEHFKQAFTPRTQRPIGKALLFLEDDLPLISQEGTFAENLAGSVRVQIRLVDFNEAKKTTKSKGVVTSAKQFKNKGVLIGESWLSLDQAYALRTDEGLAHIEQELWLNGQVRGTVYALLDFVNVPKVS